MHPVRPVIVALLVTSLWRADASAQSSAGRYEVAFLGGWTKTSSEGSVLTFDVSNTYQATFTWRIWQAATAGLSIEVPLLASPALGVKTVGSSLPKEYAALSITPGVRVSFHPERTVSFFGALGGGYVRYSESKLRLDNSPNPLHKDANAAAVQFGGGVNVRASQWLGLRGEVRDVYSGPRSFSVVTPGDLVHNVVGSVGIVLWF